MQARPSRTRPTAAYSIERRRQVRGLLLLAAAVLAFAVMRAGIARSFNPGWWRLW
jgi:hypothetical protein